jgi:hypothetical protein
MVYLKCSKNLALSARPSLEFTAFCSYPVNKVSPVTRILGTYRAGIMYRGYSIVLRDC